MPRKTPIITRLPSLELVRHLFTYNPDTGELIRRVSIRGKGSNAGTVVGTKNSQGRLICRVHYQICYVHRLIWLHYYGEEPAMIDHINCDPTDNRISNLRLTNFTQNQANRRLSKLNTSGLKGVSYAKANKKWKSAICLDKAFYHLGYFDSAIEAHKAYVDAAKRLHGEFARIE